MTGPRNARERLLDRMQAAANEIAQILLDAEHWNELHPYDVPIDPDPDGELRRLYAALAATLKAEIAREAGA